MPTNIERHQPIEDHLEKFHDWLSLSDRSKNNYLSSIRRFYHLSSRDTPLDPGGITDLDDEQADVLVDDLTQHITNTSMKYAMQKYFDWLQQLAPTPSDERTLLFYRNKVQQQDPDTVHSTIEEKVLSPKKTQELCIKTPQRMRSDQQQARLFLQMMYDTATRMSGMQWLEWQDVWREEWEGRTLEDHELVIHADRSKSKESGIVELSADTLRRLRDHKDQINPTDPKTRVFFPNLTEKSAYQKIYRNFKNTAADIGVPEASPHWYRHSRLTHLGLQMLEEGKTYPEIKERLRRYGRHRSGETTEIYIKILKNRKAESITKYSTVQWRGDQ